MMVRESDAHREADAGSFESSEELFRAGDAAESDDPAGYLRNFHASAHSPDRPVQLLLAKVGFENQIICRNCLNGSRFRQSFTEIAGRKQMIVPIVATDQENVDVTMKLPVLKSVIEDVNARFSRVSLRIHFGKLTCIILFSGDSIDSPPRFARDQQRPITVMLGAFPAAERGQPRGWATDPRESTST